MDNSFLFQTLNDNPDNIRIINESLYDIKASLFKNLYDAQYGLTDVYQTVIDFATSIIASLVTLFTLSIYSLKDVLPSVNS